MEDFHIIIILLAIASVAAYMELDFQKQEEQMKDDKQSKRLKDWKDKQ